MTCTVTHDPGETKVVVVRPPTTTLVLSETAARAIAALLAHVQCNELERLGLPMPRQVYPDHEAKTAVNKYGDGVYQPFPVAFTFPTL